MNRLNEVIIVGGGTAGFAVALSLKTKIPDLSVKVIRSPEIGIIGVGEGSLPSFTTFIHQFLGIPLQEFVRSTQPGLKTGTKFSWGSRSHFYFPFGQHMNIKVDVLPKAVGYYTQHGDCECASPHSARMQANRVFEVDAQGALQLDPNFAYHMENQRFAAFLEAKSRALGVQIIDATIESVQQDDNGISALMLTEGRSIRGDLYIDCSGFRALLIGKALGEPRIDYNSTLACDRAVVGGWTRPPGVQMLSYTCSETMDAGWCWQIDHPDRTHRGYVYSSSFITDDEAEKEFRSKNPHLSQTRIVKFTSGRAARSWVKNVVAIGNSSGFVEPLEATSLSVVATRCMLLTHLLIEYDRTVCNSARKIFNDSTGSYWDSIRSFLALHYRFNTRLKTPFWLDRTTHTDLVDAEDLVDYYYNVGPSPMLMESFLTPAAIFDFGGYLAILNGLGAPTQHTYQPSETDLKNWSCWCASNKRSGHSRATLEQSLAILAEGQPV